MPISHYGVLVGTFSSLTQDTPSNVGHYFHAHIAVATTLPNGTQGTYDCACDFNQFTGAIEYFTPSNLTRTKFGGVDALAPGFHALASNSTSGALDYVRNPFVSEPLGCLYAFVAFLNNLIDSFHPIVKSNIQPWTQRDGPAAVPDLLAAISGSTKLYIFGAQFHNAATATHPEQYGMHDIHMNQGNFPPDPLLDHNSTEYHDEQTHYASNGVWQDGGIVVEKNGQLNGFFVKFVVQSLNTDSNGNGIP
ncbi:MAG: DUF2278 family protein [bacterium]